MRRTTSLVLRTPVKRVVTAPQDSCLSCGTNLQISQHRDRRIHRLDETIDLILRDKKCPNPECPAPHLRYRPAQEPILALPGHEFGLDVLMAIGSMRMRDDFSFPRIYQRLRERPFPVPICPMTVQYLFRDYLSLVHCQMAFNDSALKERLRKQGAILPLIDGIQFGEGDPVLYLVIDLLSRQPLLGKEMFCRSADDLIPFIAQIREIGLPIIGVVSDKERALVPAISEALPGVRHQYCQIHYLGNVAKPMEDDLCTLGAEIRETEEKLRKLQRTLLRKQKKAEDRGESPPEDLQVTLELCEVARAEARCHGKAPLDPPALKRDDGLEKVAEAVADARQKKGAHGRTSQNSETF